MKKKLIYAGIFLLVVGAIGLKRSHEPPLPVKSIVVERGVVEATVSNTKAGTIKACRRSKLSMPSGGVVDKLLVNKGDAVKEGQLLLELWNRDTKANLDQASASGRQACLQAKQAGREADRLQSLAAQKLVSIDVVDKAVTTAAGQKQACEAAEARVEMQKSLMERTQLRAPFAGVVAEINGELGEYITPSPPGVLTPPAVDLIDYSCLYVTAPIDEVDAGRLRLGMNVEVSLDAFRDERFNGTITRIAPYVVDMEKQARTVDIDVKLSKLPADVKLLIGYSADTTVILERKENVLRIPTEALLVGNFVWRVNADQKLEKREVKTGIGNWSNTEIVTGLEEGDVIVRTPDQIGLEPNRSVEILTE